MDIPSETSAVLDIPPSAVAFCPSHPEYYVVGTYFLHRNDEGQETSDGPQKRTGTLILYRLEGTDFTHVQTLDLDSAVLDIEWTPHTTALEDVCCVATSTGTLEFFSFDAGAGKLQLTNKHQICDKSTLVLDLLWHPNKPDTIAVTLSDGAVSICQSDDSTNPWGPNSKVAVTELATHSLEPWTLAFSPDASHLFSGGDDAVLQSIQLSFGSDDDPKISTPSSTPLWTDRKTHQAGVTAILPLSNDLLITGSYDDHIRLLYTPPVGRRQALAELDLGGGVWRLKMLDDGTVSRGADSSKSLSSASSSDSTSNTLTLLASCMHAGSRIVKLRRRSSEGSDEWEFSVHAKFEEHKSMNYGSDVQPVIKSASGGGSGNGDAEGQRTIVSTSFYDKLMCVWRA